MSLQLCSYVYFVSFLLVFFASSSTYNDSLQVLSIMAPKQDRVIGSDDKHDPKYVPPGTATAARAAPATRATPKKVASDVVTTS